MPIRLTELHPNTQTVVVSFRRLLAIIKTILPEGPDGVEVRMDTNKREDAKLCLDAFRDALMASDTNDEIYTDDDITVLTGIQTAAADVIHILRSACLAVRMSSE